MRGPGSRANFMEKVFLPGLMAKYMKGNGKTVTNMAAE